ncbi:MAG: hypothetical protein LBJ59_03430 [Zoogloeaceae bacterium]|jgi:hypothetical protein|nr:hypothetical protein [Zoogloeaceae bacterium]
MDVCFSYSVAIAYARAGNSGDAGSSGHGYGHAYLILISSNGEIRIGYYPKKTEEGEKAISKIEGNSIKDRELGQSDWAPITKEQHDSIIEFSKTYEPDYANFGILGDNCVTAAYETLRAVGISSLVVLQIQEFEDSISLSTATAQLPDMQGSGAVRDLREAAQGAPELAAQLKALQDAGLMNREAYQMRIEAANDEEFLDDHVMERGAA